MAVFFSGRASTSLIERLLYNISAIIKKKVLSRLMQENNRNMLGLLGLLRLLGILGLLRFLGLLNLIHAIHRNGTCKRWEKIWDKQ